MLEPFLHSSPGPWLGHRSREGHQGGTSANLSTAPGSVYSCSGRPWDSVGSSLPHRQLSSSESEPQPVIMSHLSQTHHLGSDRGGSYERSFQRPELAIFNASLRGSQTASKDNLQTEDGKDEKGHTLRLRI